MEKIKKLNEYLNERTMITNLKKQYINDTIDKGEYVIIKTSNFEITVSKNNIKQIKEFETFPKILEHNIFEFDGYSIHDSIIQKSPKIKEHDAFVFFPEINYKFGDSSALRNSGILKSISNTEYIYKDISDDHDGFREFFVFLINSIRILKKVDINILNDICRKYTEKINLKAVYRVSKNSYIVKEKENGFEFSDIVSHRYYDLKMK